MKSGTIFTTALVLLFMCFWACESSSPSNAKMLTEKPKDLRNPVGLLDSLGSFEIDSAHAVNCINSYVEFSNSAKQQLVSDEFSSANDLGQYMVYGAKVRLALLLEVLSASNKSQHSNDSLFIMMGIIPTHSNPSIDSTSLIFSLKSGEDGSYQYFDFTVPCPNACPDWLTDDES